ncbi:hypothetical protein AKJ61_04155, partial [candidate division MSBL1 archaeon SCGC-AAA259B11]
FFVLKFVRNTGCEPDFLELEVGGLQIKSSRRANSFLYFSTSAGGISFPSELEFFFLPRFLGSCWSV